MTAPRFLLDTDTCIYIINRKPPGVFAHFEGLAAGEIGVSSITAAELRFGAAKSGSARNAQALEKFLAPLEVLPFDDAATREYASLRAHLERSGNPIGALDTLIAAHALALNAVLVTNNQREFARTPRLRLENWV